MTKQLPTSMMVATLSCMLASATTSFAQPRQAEDDSAELVREGREALRERDYSRAARALDQALALNGRRIDAYILRAAVHAAQKQYQAGVSLMRKAVALSPDDIDAQSALGSQLLLAKQTDEGVQILEKVVARDGRRYDAELLLGHAYYQSSRWREAITAYRAYFEVRPASLAAEDPIHRVDLADSLLRARKPADALPLFNKSVGAPNVDLRARIGAAWAMAAIDCKQARPMLAALASDAKQFPDIDLVDGQCALASGDVEGALRKGRQYLAAVPNAGAAGHALVGEAYAARNDIAAAQREFTTAQQLEPHRRRWTVRLATMLRKSGKPSDALAALDRLGPPKAPDLDLDWWLEVGESEMANGDAKNSVARLAAVQSTFVDDPRLLTVLGIAQLRSGDVVAGTTSLQAALVLDKNAPRTRKALSAAFAERGAGLIEQGQFDAAIATLQQARELDASTVVLRNLALALLALDQKPQALEAIAAIAKPDWRDDILRARALIDRANFAPAREYFTRALRNATAADASLAAIEAASAELEFGEPSNAVALLEKVATKSDATLRDALSLARTAAGLAAIRSGNGGKAVEYLREGNDAKATVAQKCQLALAYVVNGDRDPALRLLRAVAGKACPFPAPADTQAAPILEAYLDGLNPRRAAAALAKLSKLAARSTGSAAALLATAIRVVAMSAAADSYRAGNTASARGFLAQAKRITSRVGNDELAVNLAVVDVADGQGDLSSAMAQLERLSAKVPEALVSLGIAHDRQSDAGKALDAWRRARRAGVKFPPLTDWIESKERVLGGTP
jgi:tetratricopeptide (TPR) repeat protein